MINKNWKDHWKLVANNKNNTARHMVQYCILKALTAKSQNKVEIAQSMLRAAFTPVTNERQLANGRSQFDTLESTLYRSERRPSKIFGLDLSLFFDEAGYEEYVNLISLVLGSKIKENEPDYVFIFVRQDISNEQQAVQAAHATYVAGSNIPADVVAEHVHFVLVGVPGEEELTEAAKLIDKNKILYHEFREPDLGDSLTALATQPMKEHAKRFLRAYRTLKFAT